MCSPCRGEVCHAYVIGSTTADDFPTSSGAIQENGTGGSDAFVAKLNRSGTALLYATLLGGKNDDHGFGIALDGAGNAAVTGDTTSADFPTTADVAQGTYAGGGEPFGDAFVARLNGSGTTLIYATFLGGSGNDSGTSIALDAAGSAYVTGETTSNDFPSTSSAAQPDLAGGYNAFIAKLNGNGSTLRYATYLGGSASDAAYGIAVDAAGSAYITGTTSSTDFPVTPGAQQTTKGDLTYPWDAFVAKLNPAGAAFTYVTFLGGPGDDHAFGIAVDDAGQAYVVGNTFSPDFLGTPLVKLAGGYDAFIAKLDVTGNAVLYGSYVGSPGSDGGFGIALDQWDNAYITGNTDSSAFPRTWGGLQPQRSGGQDAFVARLVIPARHLPALDPVSPPSGTSTTVRYFAGTHYTIRGPFLAFYVRYSGSLVFGLPLSEAFPDGDQTVQYFERARLVIRNGRVTISPLGEWLTAGRPPPTQPLTIYGTSLRFPSTGHTLSQPFLAFWLAHHGSLVFGPPIYGPLMEQNGDGSGTFYAVEYFRNARLEYHFALRGTPYEVSVGLLGREYLRRQGLL